MTGRVRIEVLGPAHDRSGFTCGVTALDDYLRERVGQDVRRRMAACFVAASGRRVVGFYTLSAAAIPISDLPPEVARRLPRYPTVPATRLGRLAVASDAAGQGLGGALLADAVHRALRAEIASFAMIVDAKDEPAAAFYRHHAFVAFGASGLRLFLPLATARVARDGG
jgi:ribosomal protein S18 acetylase RimI-like enzyme